MRIARTQDNFSRLFLAHEWLDEVELEGDEHEWSAAWLMGSLSRLRETLDEFNPGWRDVVFTEDLPPIKER